MDYNSSRIGPIRFYKHDKSLKLLNDLAIDLKKRELGLKHSPITVERIDQIMREVREDLERCYDYGIQRLRPEHAGLLFALAKERTPPIRIDNPPPPLVEGP